MATRKKLKQFRVIDCDLSQDGMAKKIGCNRMTYADVENGKRGISPTFLQNFAKAFNMSIAEADVYLKLEN